MSYSTKQTQGQQRTLGIPIPTQKQWLERIAQSKYLNYSGDFYSQGELVELLEQRIATLLNKPACLYFNKGMQAQFAALKVSEARKNNAKFLMHPLSHIAWDEADAFESLLGLDGIKVGKLGEAITLKDIGSQTEEVATLVLELPLRRAGFKLPPWNELLAIQEWANERRTHLHFDGARLWECTSHYEKSAAQIASCCDSVYVSLYKGLGALGGAVLAGNADFIEACRVWRTRLAGDAFSSFPQLVTALDGLDQNLDRIPEYVQRAQTIAANLGDLPGLEVDPPKTNGFFVFIEGDKEILNAKAQVLNKEKDLKLFSAVNQSPFKDKLYVELQVGRDHKLIANEEVVDYFSELLSVNRPQ